MTDLDNVSSAASPAGGEAAGPKAKAAPPGLAMRAARPPAVRLRKSVVQAIVIGGAVLVSGSLAWAFVIQPELRAGARERTAEAREDASRGTVRPSELVTDQPASYDRLPEPRTAEPEQGVEETSTVAGSTAAPRSPRYDYVPPRAPAGPSPHDLAVRSALFFGETGSAAGPPAAAPPSASASASTGQSSVYNPNALTAPVSPFELKAGAIVAAVLLTGVDTAREGPVVATVSQNVFDSVSGRYLLIPQGARLIGRHEGESRHGDRRAFLTWDRLILPNGKSLILTEEPGVDAQGAIGLPGRVDRRLLPLLMGTLFAGAITTLGQIARDDGDGSRGFIGDAGDAAAIEGSQVGGRLIDRELQVRPSVRLRAGAPVRVMITRDLVLEPYQP